MIYGKDYGIAQLGGIGFADNPHQVRLCDLRLRINSRFRYEYDFGDLWQHQLQLERILPLEHTDRYPSCTGGARAAPPEDCGDPWAFLALKQHYTPGWLAHQLLAILQNKPDELDVDDLAGWITGCRSTALIAVRSIAGCKRTCVAMSSGGMRNRKGEPDEDHRAVAD